MPHPGFSVSANEIEPGWEELRLEGELDLAVADRLQAAIEALEGERVLLDLSDCEFIDSTGIAVIVRAARERAESGGRVAAHSPRAQVLRVLTITGLTGNGLVFEDREAALSALARVG